MPTGIVTLLSDFGIHDPFVGVMKGVILSHFSEAQIVDLTHAIPAQDIACGAFWLAKSVKWFPVGTVHVAVVDPGVGSARAALAAVANGQILLGPDNGLLAETLARSSVSSVYAVDVARLGLSPPSSTFHGRDVFAPVAAELAAARIEPADVGPALAAHVATPLPVARVRAGAIEGEVVLADHFGNLLTNIESEQLSQFTGPRVHIAQTELGLSSTYSDVAAGELVALVNAFGVLEVACRGASAAQRLGAGRGTLVCVRRVLAPP
jgi:S-adenosylmethionine hydrolase